MAEGAEGRAADPCMHCTRSCQPAARP
jgi:hypothetical protein